MVLINDILKEVINILDKTFKKAIEIKTTFSDNLPFTDGDGGQLHQVFMNICVNARDAMPNGGKLTINTRLTNIDNKFIRKPLELPEGNYIEITISDTGTGMDEVILHKIFEPFFTTKERGKGTGLGLSVVYGIVSSHNGFITVDSKAGDGTIFKIYLPISRFQAEVATKPQKEELIRGNETIMLVDDEDMIRKICERFLNKLGYNVHLAESGKSAIKIYKENQQDINLVIMDMAMQGMNGEETFKHLKQINNDVKVLIASGLIEPEHKKIMEDAGVMGFLQKPYTLDHFAKAIRELLNGK